MRRAAVIRRVTSAYHAVVTGDDPRVLQAATIGEAWLAVAERILADGTASAYDGLPVREISHMTLELVSYAHSIDFGAKGYGNLVELAGLQRFVAGELGRPAGRLLMVVKSAHVYRTESQYVRGVLAQSKRRALG